MLGIFINVSMPMTIASQGPLPCVCFPAAPTFLDTAKVEDIRRSAMPSRNTCDACCAFQATASKACLQSLFPCGCRSKQQIGSSGRSGQPYWKKYGPLGGLVPLGAKGELACPPAIVAARAFVAALPPVRELRPKVILELLESHVNHVEVTVGVQVNWAPG